jgi:hypothetical protein
MSQGMVELNGAKRHVRVLNPHSFAIGDTTGCSPYTTGGIAMQLQRTQTLHFQSLAEQVGVLLSSSLCRSCVFTAVRFGCSCKHPVC